MGNFCVKTLVGNRRNSPVSQHDWDGAGFFRRIGSNGRRLSGEYCSRFSKWRDGERGTGVCDGPKEAKAWPLTDDVYLPASVYAARALARGEAVDAFGTAHRPVVGYARTSIEEPQPSTSSGSLPNSWTPAHAYATPVPDRPEEKHHPTLDVEPVVEPPPENPCAGMTDAELVTAIVRENRDRIMRRFNLDTYLKKWADAMVVKEPDPESEEGQEEEEAPFGAGEMAEAACPTPAPTPTSSVQGGESGFDEGEFAAALEDEPVVLVDGDGDAAGGQTYCDCPGACNFEVAEAAAAEVFAGWRDWDEDEEEELFALGQGERQRPGPSSMEGVSVVLVPGAGPKVEDAWVRKTFPEMEEQEVTFYFDA